ncbi:hypothetical protein Ahia01_000540500 [Argonauta hians]
MNQMIEALKQHRITLLAVDFDMTLVELHTGGIWNEAVEDLLEHFRPSILKLIDSSLDHPRHIKVCIVTYFMQPWIIEELLALALPHRDASQILVRGNTDITRSNPRYRRMWPNQSQHRTPTPTPTSSNISSVSSTSSNLSNNNKGNFDSGNKDTGNLSSSNVNSGNFGSSSDSRGNFSNNNDDRGNFSGNNDDRGNSSGNNDNRGNSSGNSDNRGNFSGNNDDRGNFSGNFDSGNDRGNFSSNNDRTNISSNEDGGHFSRGNFSGSFVGNNRSNFVSNEDGGGGGSEGREEENTGGGTTTKTEVVEEFSPRRLGLGVGCSVSGGGYGKEEHIEWVIAQLRTTDPGFNIEPENVLLLDDDPDNVSVALSYGHRAFLVDPRFSIEKLYRYVSGL